MNKFLTWYAESTGKTFEPQDVTPVLLQDYRSHMQTVENCKPATINKAWATLKTTPKWLNQGELNRLLYAVEGQNNDFKRCRDIAIVRTMLDAGLRVEEVSELRLDHIDIKGETVNVVNGKGGKYRSVPMTKELRKVLKAWLAFRTDCDKPVHQESEFLFVSERAGKMTTRAIAYVVDGYLERAGLLERTQDGAKTDGFSCHSLRHTFCKRLQLRLVDSEYGQSRRA